MMHSENDVNAEFSVGLGYLGFFVAMIIHYDVIKVFTYYVKTLISSIATHLPHTNARIVFFPSGHYRISCLTCFF